MKENYSLDQFTFAHGRTIPTTFEQKVKYFAEAGMNAEEICDRIYMSEKFVGGSVGSQDRLEKTELYYRTLKHVKAEMAKLD